MNRTTPTSATKIIREPAHARPALKMPRLEDLHEIAAEYLPLLAQRLVRGRSDDTLFACSEALIRELDDDKINLICSNQKTAAVIHRALIRCAFIGTDKEIDKAFLLLAYMHDRGTYTAKPSVIKELRGQASRQLNLGDTPGTAAGPAAFLRVTRPKKDPRSLL